MSKGVHITATALWCILTFTAGAAIAADQRELKHNPFTRPPSERTVPEIDRATFTDGIVQPLDLRATMVGTLSRFANVGGRILRPGDEFQGYTLVKVYEDRAVFSRQGKQEIIYVKPDPVESDE